MKSILGKGCFWFEQFDLKDFRETLISLGIKNGKIENEEMQLFERVGSNLSKGNVSNGIFDKSHKKVTICQIFWGGTF